MKEIPNQENCSIISAILPSSKTEKSIVQNIIEN